jgi:hypothetical protein
MFTRALPLTQIELSRLGIQECLKKPFSARELADRTQAPRPSIAVTGSPSAIAEGATTTAALDDAGFQPVLTEEFLSGKPSPFDIYVRVNPGQYVRVLNAGDTLEPERVQRFISLGAHHLYLSKQPFQRCLSYCDLLARTLALSSDVSVEVRLLQLATQGEDLSRMVRALAGKPLGPVHLDLANAFLAQLALLIRKAKKNQRELADEFLRNASAMEHAVSVTFVTALLSTELGIESPAIWAQLGLAAFFHDIGLYELPEKLIALDSTGTPGDAFEMMTAAELQRYQQHPVRSVEILSANRVFESATLQSVLQHHERRDNSGFPRRLGPDQITPMAEIIGISDEFVRLLKRQETDSDFNAVKAMEPEIFNGFSFRTVKAFKTVFS